MLELAICQSLRSEAGRVAAHNREHFDARGIPAVNLMSSPGSGKTRLLAETIEAIGD
jgi:hydrogenase nickel incorporation protein HypB